jgi:hypothetical protein
VIPCAVPPALPQSSSSTIELLNPQIVQIADVRQQSERNA